MRRASRTINRASAMAPTTPRAQTISGGMTVFSPRESSQPVARPQRPRLERGDDFLGKADARKRRERERLDPLGTTAEPAALGGNERHRDALAVTLAQGAAQIADPVDEAKFLRLAASPILAAE